MPRRTLRCLLMVLAIGANLARAEPARKVIVDQDSSGPATTDLLSVLALVQSPATDVLGITVVSGDQWRDEEVAHTLRMLEIIGRSDIPVVPGAVFPLINRKEEVARWERLTAASATRAPGTSASAARSGPGETTCHRSKYPIFPRAIPASGPSMRTLRPS